MAYHHHSSSPISHPVLEENYTFNPYGTPNPQSANTLQRGLPYAGTTTRQRRAGIGGIGGGGSQSHPLNNHNSSSYSSASPQSTASSGATGTFTARTVIMPPKRQTPTDLDEVPTTKPKQQKVDNPEAFSHAVKQRLAASSRTGQACDRCKVRKIKCDGRRGACTPCAQNKSDCFTTDRITGRAVTRGYVEDLEDHNDAMLRRVQELEDQLAKTHNGTVTDSTYDYDPAAYRQSRWASPNTPYGQQPKAPGNTHGNASKSLPAFRPGCTGDNYLGVSADNSGLSSIKGTALSILGMEIDIADFKSPDMDEPDPSVFNPRLYNKSYQAFLQSVLNVNMNIEKMELPPRADGFTYIGWYFKTCHAFVPILHPPTFLKLVARFYDEPDFQPTSAETVSVHMVFAIMFFQYAARNWENAVEQAHMTDMSNKHYHYSLAMFYQLAQSHTFRDVQALTLICAHLRSFPKPGASWMLTQITMTLAIELGLHRSATRWANHSLSTLEVESRKRTFWALLTIHVALSGKLGRPMALRMEDLDVEMLEEIDDDLLLEKGLAVSRPAQCRHRPGVHVNKLLPLFIELYTAIYAVRRQPETYVTVVTNLERRLRKWKEELPEEFKGDVDKKVGDIKLYALYAEAFELEFHMLLRHPSVSMTNDAEFNSEGMRICVESSRRLLQCARRMQELKCLDTTWCNSAIYVMAITTMLFGQWEKPEISADDIAALNGEMDQWLDIMRDVGGLLGAGGRLYDAVKSVTDRTIAALKQRVPVPSPLPPKRVKEEDFKPINRAVSAGPISYSHRPQPPRYDADNHANSAANSSSFLTTEAQGGHQPTPYPTGTQYTPYTTRSPTSVTDAYVHPESADYNHYRPQTTGAEAGVLTTALISPQSSQPLPNAWATPLHYTHSGSDSWNQWTTAMSGNVGSQDQYSASALMDLGRDASRNGIVPVTTVEEVPPHQVVNVTVDAGQLGGRMNAGIGMNTWPMNILFDLPPG